MGQSPHHHHTLSASCLESLRCCCCTCCQYPSSDGGRARHCSELTWRRPCCFRGTEVLESLTWWQNALAHSTRSDRTGFTPLTLSLTAFFSESLSFYNKAALAGDLYFEDSLCNTVTWWQELFSPGQVTQRL